MASVLVKPKSGHKYQLEITAGKHTVICDQPSSAGGSDGGPDPKELLLASLGACAAQTILMVAPQRGWDIQELSITVSYSKSGGQETYTEDIEVKGNLTQAELDAIKRIGEKCPVMRAFTGTKTVNASITKT